MNLYFISGLGADHRAFQRIRIHPRHHLCHIDWISPLKGESLQDYAHRLSALFNTSEKFAIAGLSFGGMIAVELGRIIKPEKIIIISSTGSFRGIPWYFRFAGKLKLHKLIPAGMLEKPRFPVFWLFGTAANRERRILSQFIRSSSPAFLRWAIDAILAWKGNNDSSRLVHIHGSHDRLLPLRFLKPDIIIPGGSHFMIWTRADEISRHLNQILDGLNDHPQL